MSLRLIYTVSQDENHDTTYFVVSIIWSTVATVNF